MCRTLLHITSANFIYYWFLVHIFARLFYRSYTVNDSSPQSVFIKNVISKKARDQQNRYKVAEGQLKTANNVEGGRPNMRGVPNYAYDIQLCAKLHTCAITQSQDSYLYGFIVTNEILKFK